MTQDDKQEVLKLYQDGYSSSRIKTMLGLEASERTVQRLVQKAGIARSYQGKGQMRVGADNTSPTFVKVVRAAMVATGRDSSTCDKCSIQQPYDCEIINPNPNTLSVDDLLFVCESCKQKSLVGANE